MLVTLAAAGGARADALREAQAAERTGDAARAYAAYRLHATHELPAGSDAMRALLPILDRAFGAWIDAVLSRARQQIAAADPEGALSLLWGVARIPEAILWVNAIPGHEVAPQLAARRRELNAIAAEAIDSLLAETTDDLEGFRRLAALAPLAPTVPRLRARLDELRATLGAPHRERARRPDHVGRLHQAVLDYLDGKAPDGRPSGVTISPRAEGDPSCAPFAASLARTGTRGALHAELVVRTTGPCQLATSQVRRTEPYEYTVSESYETQECTKAATVITRGRCLSANNQNCVLEATPTTSGGETTCRPVTRTRTRRVRDTREVTRTTWSIPWRGELTLTTDGGEARRPLDVTGTFADEGYRSARGDREARLDRRALERSLATQAAARVADASRELEATRVAAARARFAAGGAPGVIEPDAALLYFEDRRSAELETWLVNNADMPRAVLEAIRSGQVIAPLTPAPLVLPALSAGEPCPTCLAVDPLVRKQVALGRAAPRAEGWIGVRYTRVGEPGRLAGAAQVYSVPVEYDVVPRTGTGMFAGFDLELGGGAGFRYDTNLRAGWGVSKGGGTIGATVGAGVGGLTGGRIPIALQVPVEVLVTYRFAAGFALAASARPSFTFGADARKGGSATTPLGDELELGLTILAGKKLALAGLYSERMGTSLVGVALGYQLQPR